MTTNFCKAIVCIAFLFISAFFYANEENVATIVAFGMAILITLNIGDCNCEELGIDDAKS